MEHGFANTPDAPYYAVIFTSQRTGVDDGYGAMGDRMVELASRQPGFLGVESARDAQGLGITVSYWASLEAIAEWRKHPEHRVAQAAGYSKWYSQFSTRVSKVERASVGP
jgi:heme-degrading monooxygenase HmoA